MLSTRDGATIRTGVDVPPLLKSEGHRGTRKSEKSYWEKIHINTLIEVTISHTKEVAYRLYIFTQSGDLE